MNERLKELAVQAGGVWSEDWGCFMSGTLNLTRFTELIRQDEREACARVCEDEAEGLVGDDVSGADGAWYCANAIRARAANRTKNSKDICDND